MEKLIINDLKKGFIYSIDYGPNLQLIGRYSHSDITNHYLQDSIKYWNGSEIERTSVDYFTSNIGFSIRPASLSEKQNYCRFLIEKELI